MKSTTKFVPITKEKLEQLSVELKDVLSEADLKDFQQYVKPYETFGSNQLDDIFVIAEVTIEGNGQVQSLDPSCAVDQKDWYMYEDEPDIRIDPVSIAFKTLTPKAPFKVEGTATFFAVFEAKGNIWDSCKDLPDWIWNKGKFEFMLSVTITTEDGSKAYGSAASQVITF